jgi:hypothetical protein
MPVPFSGDEQIEARILVEPLTREEFLGEPDRIDFLQPPRPPSPPAVEERDE